MAKVMATSVKWAQFCPFNISGFIT